MSRRTRVELVLLAAVILSLSLFLIVVLNEPLDFLP